MKRTVVVHRAADRHQELHRRAFAKTQSAVVQDGTLAAVVAAALAAMNLENIAEGKWTIDVDWPYV
jgi:hypothetical protein